MTDENAWVIWSFEHDAWWAPHECGYVLELDQAGRYTEARAKVIEARANIVHRHEVALSLADALAHGIPP
jgi:hypothetical protein